MTLHALAQPRRERLVVRVVRLLLQTALDEHPGNLAFLLIREGQTEQPVERIREILGAHDDAEDGTSRLGVHPQTLSLREELGALVVRGSRRVPSRGIRPVLRGSRREPRLRSRRIRKPPLTAIPRTLVHQPLVRQRPQRHRGVADGVRRAEPLGERRGEAPLIAALGAARAPGARARDAFIVLEVHHHVEHEPGTFREPAPLAA